ncbi:hypothetical protein B0H66DRAFT_550207 [Apodospora peruviana]|uniref:AAA+ ATPase domain-containing protein n=1 Tax=Apodospora peruviana TaxID=516989 RepID=A0AAE0IJM1_9PEZI|nr:hypothetical protein B0H66DRAFT_550207 [Apodospora peruviana]
MKVTGNDSIESTTPTTGVIDGTGTPATLTSVPLIDQPEEASGKPTAPSLDGSKPGSANSPSGMVDGDRPSDHHKDQSNRTLIATLQEAPTVQMIAEARKCNFKEFVNRFTIEEASYAIEYLEAGPGLGKEMTKEALQRHRDKVEGYEDENTDEYKSRRLNGGLMDDTWIHAVRIQSQSVLKVLSEAGGYVWGQEPYTFMRPFAHLIHFHPKIKDRFESIKAESPSGDEFEQLQCYVSFVEEHLLPLVHQFDDVQSSTTTRVRHDDLWYLFKPGELVYVPGKGLEKEWKDEESSSSTRHLQKIWRLENLEPHLSDFDRSIYGTSEAAMEAHACVHYIDWDGSSYKPAQFSLQIPGFDGLKDVRKLEVYPLRFAPDAQALLAEQRELGQRYDECIKQRHVSYKAWTLLTDPMGNYCVDAKGKKVRNPEFIDGDVIIDFKEAFNAFPSWKYFPYQDLFMWESRIETRSDQFPIFLWSDTSRTKLLFSWPHVVVSKDDIGFLEGSPFRQKQPYGLSGLDKPLDKDLAIIPRRLYGYALRERKFVLLDVKGIKVGHEWFDTDPFRFLQIDPDNKRTIKCLVSDHFSTKQLRKAGEIASQDPIPGKGRSLVFLLHGPPGVGKTATVEAVAQAYRKPLFSITSGDLGSTPERVEKNLADLFHLANVWDCILLLDEADVFLEEREKRDLGRNAVVSVFLRVMEYYSGILFLTTNRPGQLDEAVKSRVHSTLLYHSLDLHQTKEIFRLNIERLELIERQRQANPEKARRRLHGDRSGILAFAEKHWYKHEKDELGRWNGRQIRNAFIHAAALARYDDDYDDDRDDDDDEGPSTAVVTERHFEFVARSVTTFDNYMARARGGLDSERARTRMDRPDHFVQGEERSTRTPRRTAPAPSNPLPSSYYTTSTNLHAPPPATMTAPPAQPHMINTYTYAQPGYNIAPSLVTWPPVQAAVQASPMGPLAPPSAPGQSFQNTGGQQDASSVSTGGVTSQMTTMSGT